MDEILGTKINIKFWKSKLGVEIKHTMDKIKYKTYMYHTGTIKGSVLSSSVSLIDRLFYWN